MSHHSALELETLNKEYKVTLTQYNRAANDYTESLQESSWEKSKKLLMIVSNLNDKLTEIGEQITSKTPADERIQLDELKNLRIGSDNLKIDLHDLNVEKDKIYKMLRSIDDLNAEQTDGSLKASSNYYGYIVFMLITLLCILGVVVLGGLIKKT